MDDLTRLALEAHLASGSTSELLEGLRTLLAVRLLDEARKDTAQLARVLLLVEERQRDAGAGRAPSLAEQLEAARERRKSG